MNVTIKRFNSTVYLDERDVTINFTSYETEKPHPNDELVVWLFYGNDIIGSFFNAQAMNFLQCVGVKS